MGLSRRDFLKMGGSACLVMGAGAALAGCAPKGEEGAASAEGEYVVGAADINFTKETEILIVGTGIAGLAAGMEPSMAGKKITFIDKQATYGGDSIASCWFGFSTGAKIQTENGYPMTAAEKWEASKEKTLDPKRALPFDWYAEWAERKNTASAAWMDCAADNFGATWMKPFSDEELPGMGAAVVLPEKGIGSGAECVMEPMKKQLEANGAEFIMDTRATALIKDPEGRVIGCRCVDNNSGKIIDIKAKATVVATGCFIDNQEMMCQYEPDYKPYGNLVNYSTGDGQLMMAAAGAKLFNMEGNYANLMGDIPNATTWGYWAPIVLVLPNGKRFIEEGQSHDAAQAAVDAGYREWWVLFDQQAFDARGIADSVQKNVKSRADVYHVADTVEDLAAQIDVPVDALVATFNRYNELVDAGEDADFGKKKHLKKLVPPFHALREHVVRYKSIGGALCDNNNMVLDEKDAPIPGLYATGAATTLSMSSVSTCGAIGYYCGKSLVETVE